METRIQNLAPRAFGVKTQNPQDGAGGTVVAGRARVPLASVGAAGRAGFGAAFYQIATGFYRINRSGNRFLPHITAPYRINFFAKRGLEPIWGSWEGTAKAQCRRLVRVLCAGQPHVQLNALKCG